MAKYSCPEGEVVCTKYQQQHHRTDVVSPVWHATCSLYPAHAMVQLGILQPGNISTGLWLHALDCYSSFKTAFSFFHMNTTPKEVAIIKSSSHPINNWSSKGVSNQGLDLIWYPRHYIKRLRNNLFSFCVSHILSASMHSGIPLKTKKPYVNFQAYDPPLGFFFFLLCLSF